ncbi:MAG: hypothetical protein AAF318_19160 [Pseudomonadota bacterium]
MNTILRRTALILAVIIGALSLTPAQAAPMGVSAAAAISQSVETGGTEVHHRKRWRRKKHFRRHHAYYGFRHKRCYLKRIKVWDPYYGGYYWKKRRFCRW